MAHVIADRIADTSTTTGTGDFTVDNAPPSGYETLNAVLSSSDTFDYMIQNRSANEWEVGVGTYSGSHVFVRTTVQQSSNADAAVNFSAGTKDILIVNSAYRIKNPLITRVVASHTDYAARFVNTTDAASFLEVARFEGDRATPTDGDGMQIGFYLSNDVGEQVEAARMTWVLSDVTDGTEDSALLWMLYTGGSPEYFLRLEPTTLSPASNNLIALGSTSVGWADLHLASGGVINWANGEVTLTETDANTLTLAGGTLVLPDSGLQVGASNPFSDSAGTLTLQNVDALDATTEATIEAAIDTLANLTSVQGRTVTLADAGANAIFGWDDTAGAYENLSASEATAIINAFTGDSGSGGVKGLVPAPAAGDAAAGKYLDADGTFSVPPGTPLAGFRNRLINGGMRINQRAPATNADDSYAHDRWYILTQTDTVAVTSQTAIENGWTDAMRITQSQASAQRFGVAQIIEANNCQDLRGQAVALSARVRCSASTTLRFAILEWTGTADTVTSDVVNDWTSGTFTAGNFFNSTTLTVTATGSQSLTANTAASVSLTGTLGSSVNNVIVIFWTDSTQAQNVTLDIGKVQFEDGDATEFEHRPYNTERNLCLRYCDRYTVSASNGPYFTCGQSDSTTSLQIPFIFSVAKRSTPTMSTSSTAADFNVRHAGTATNCSAVPSSTGLDATGGVILVTVSSGLTAGRAGYLRNGTSTTYVQFEAEL